MTKLLKTLNTLGAIADCIPVVSLIVNGTILSYQKAHKVDQAANPVNKGWRSDFKLYALSKDKNIAKASLVPGFGNITALIMQVRRKIQLSHADRMIPPYSSSLVEAADPRSKMHKHSLEIANLYLAQNPELSNEELMSAMKTASRFGNKEIFDLLFERKEQFSALEIKEILSPCASAEITEAVLTQIDPDLLSIEDKEYIFHKNCLDYPGTVTALLDHLSTEDVLYIYNYFDRPKGFETWSGMYRDKEFKAFEHWITSHEDTLTDDQKILIINPEFGIGIRYVVSYFWQRSPPPSAEFLLTFARKNRNISEEAVANLMQSFFPWDIKGDTFAFSFCLETFQNATLKVISPLYSQLLNYGGRDTYVYDDAEKSSYDDYGWSCKDQHNLCVEAIEQKFPELLQDVSFEESRQKYQEAAARDFHHYNPKSSDSFPFTDS